MKDSSAHRGSGEPVLQLHDVTKSYGGTPAVNKLNLRVHRGEVVSILGPNGAGKTTTIEMCEGFITPDSGSISVFGKNPAQDSDHVRSRIGAMLQSGGAYPGIRVAEMLRLVASYYDNPLDPRWLLEVVGLTHHTKTPYRRLSGGQQQRLSLACALIGRPELIFLDEPTAGLDAQSRLVVWDLIESLKRDGVAVVLTTHLMDEAESLADFIYIIDHGHLIASGTPEHITRQAHNKNTPAHIELRFAHHTQESDLQRYMTLLVASVDKNLTLRHNKNDQLSIEGLDPTPRNIALLTDLLAQENIPIKQLSINQHSLEEVFLNLTGREIRS